MPISRGVIVSVGTGPRFCGGLRRLNTLIPPHEQFIYWMDRFPPGSPTHLENPYAFKVCAIQNVKDRNFTSVIWMDSSILVLKPLDSIWELMNTQGYWFCRNYDHMADKFCCDASLEIMGLSRQEAATIPVLVGGAFGLNFKFPISVEFFIQWRRMAELGAFRGPHRNDNGESSTDRSVIGHRHDQVCASVVAHRLGTTLTPMPKYLVEQGDTPAEDTVLTVLR